MNTPAINSTIQELVPARYRGWTDPDHQRQLLDWRGARRNQRHRVLLDPNWFDVDLGWRLAYFTGMRLASSCL